MSFIPKNPLILPKVKNPPSIPNGTRGIFADEDGWYSISDDGGIIRLATINDIQGGGVPLDTEMSDTSENAVQNKVIKSYVDNKVPTKISQLEDDLEFGRGLVVALNTAEDALREALSTQNGLANGTLIPAKATNANFATNADFATYASGATSAGHAVSATGADFATADSEGNNIIDTYAKKPTITSTDQTALSFEFDNTYNTEIRSAILSTLSFTFGDGEYEAQYTSGLSFDSGETPTTIDYTDSGILNWVGTDCTTSDGLSIFQPSASTHYDIVFYFNGAQFIGLVNGFVPASGNVVSE